MYVKKITPKLYITHFDKADCGEDVTYLHLFKTPLSEYKPPKELTFREYKRQSMIDDITMFCRTPYFQPIIIT